MSEQAYLFLGDSITDAGHLWEEDPRMLGRGFIRKISEQPEFCGARLVNRGQDGFTSADLLRLVRRLSDLDSYSCITVLIGVNDLSVHCYADPAWIPQKFSAHIRELMTLLRRYHKGRLLLLEPFLFIPPAEHLRLLPALDEEREILIRAAKSFQAEYVPLQEALDRAVRQYGVDAVTVDGIHLTDTGNRILANQWIQQIQR